MLAPQRVCIEMCVLCRTDGQCHFQQDISSSEAKLLADEEKDLYVGPHLRSQDGVGEERKN